MRPLGALLLSALLLLLTPACGHEDEGEEEALRDRVVRVAAQVAEIRGLAKVHPQKDGRVKLLTPLDPKTGLVSPST